MTSKYIQHAISISEAKAQRIIHVADGSKQGTLLLLAATLG